MPALCAAGFAVIGIETRQVKAALTAMRNKTDRNDARGIAQIMRTGWFRMVHVKGSESHELRFLLTNRKTLQRKALDIENEIRGTLKAFGLKVGKVSRRRFEARVLELTADRAALLLMVKPMLRARAALIEEFNRLHRMVLNAVRDDPLCRRLMSIPGVGGAGRPDLPGGRRCPATVRQVEERRRPFRAHAAAVQLR